MCNICHVRPLPGIIGINDPGVIRLRVAGNRQQRLVGPSCQYFGMIFRCLLSDNLLRFLFRDLPNNILRVRHVPVYGSDSSDSRPVLIHDQLRSATVNGQISRLLLEGIVGHAVLRGPDRLQNQPRRIVAAQPVHHAAHRLQRGVLVLHVLIERLVDHAGYRFAAVQHRVYLIDGFAHRARDGFRLSPLLRCGKENRQQNKHCQECKQSFHHG